MATVACKCGEKFHPGPEHIGKEVKCRRCGRTVKLIPDPSLEPPAQPKRAPFSQTFSDASSFSAPSAYRPPAPPPEPPFDPNAPRGLHPEVRRILIYGGILAAIIAIVLIASVFKSSSPPPVPTQSPDAGACC